MELTCFHPAVRSWLLRKFGSPTAAQAWPAICGGRHTLIAAPTGSGKTLAAFLAAIDSLVRQAACGNLEDRTQVLVAGFTGEQYALPGAVDALRALCKMPPTGTLMSLSAADPPNLAGIITPGERVPAIPGNRVLYRDGIPVAARIGRETRFFGALGPASEWEAHNALLRTNTPLLAGRLN